MDKSENRRIIDLSDVVRQHPKNVAGILVMQAAHHFTGETQFSNFMFQTNKNSSVFGMGQVNNDPEPSPTTGNEKLVRDQNELIIVHTRPVSRLRRLYDFERFILIASARGA